MDRHGGFKVHNIKAWMLQAQLSENDTDILLRKCIDLGKNILNNFFLINFT